MFKTVEKKLQDLGLTIPDSPLPSANYVPYTKSGNLVFISGQISIDKGNLVSGKLGRDLEIEEGQLAAKVCALNIISHLHRACNGSLERLEQVIKLGGFVNSTSDFGDAPQVIDGASDLFIELFGDRGKHARFAVCAHCLPRNAAVEIDGIFKIR